MIEYRLLKEIEKNPAHTQRTLAQSLNVSLGKVNYCLSGLMEKGVIKARKFKNNPDKIRWNYLLTPMGLKEKMRITRDYLQRRLNEFSSLQTELDELKKEIELETAKE